MRALTAPRILPDNPRYFEVDIPDRGMCGFRTPMPVHASRLQLAMIDDGILDVGNAVRLAEKDAETEAERKAARIRVATENPGGTINSMMLGGAAIGLSWWGRDRKIECHPRDFDHDLHQYGEAVLEELYDDGWTTAQISAAYVPLVSRILKSLRPPGVGERADFSEAQEGASN